MMPNDTAPRRLAHGLRRMTGRDPHEDHRAATPLELLYDLTLVIAFGAAGSQLAHLVAEGHILPGVIGFAIAVFAVSWPWVNLSWFNSAFDTDDWYVRIAVLVQMVGVVIVVQGIPELFHGLDDGWEVHNTILVAGYVVMRCGMLMLWIRAAREHPGLSRTCLRYARGIALAQIAWVVLAVLHLPGEIALPAMALMFLVEIGIPGYAESRGTPTPWHPEHIAERYGLLVIISLGEIVLGTSTAVQEVVDQQGWSLDAVVVLGAGISLAFALWWVYFGLPFAIGLERRHPRPAFVFGFGHMLVFGAIAAVGAGLHVAAYYVSRDLHAGPVAAVVSTAVPTALVIALLTAIYHAHFPGRRTLHHVLVAGAVALAALAIVLSIAGVPVSVCIAIVMLAPWTTVIGFETVGHRHISEDVSRD